MAAKVSADTDTAQLEFSPSWREHVLATARRFGMSAERFIREAVRHYTAHLDGSPLPEASIKLTRDALYRQQASRYQRERWARMTHEQRAQLSAKFSERATERWQKKKGSAATAR